MAEARSESRRTVLFVAVATAFSLLGDQVLYAVVPVMHESLGLSAIQVGILLSANRWIRLLTNELAHQFAAGHRSRRWAKWYFVAAFALGAATTAAYSATNSFTVLLLARLAWGLSWSFIRHFGVGAVMLDAPAYATGRTMGLYNGISRAGSVAGLFGGAVLVDLVGFHLGMWVLAALSLLAVPLALRGYRTPSGDSGTATLSSATQAVVEPSKLGLPLRLLLLGLVLGAVGPGFVMSTLGASLTIYMDGNNLFSAATLTGALLALRYLMDSVLAPWLGGAFDRYGFYRCGVAYLVVGGLALLAASVAPPAWVFVGLILLFFNCATGLQAGVAGNVSRLGSGAYARYVTASDLGSAMGPLFGWFVIAQFDSPLVALAIGGVFFVVGALAVPAALHSDEKDG